MKGRDEIRPTLAFGLLTGGKLRKVTLQCKFPFFQKTHDSHKAIESVTSHYTHY